MITDTPLLTHLERSQILHLILAFFDPGRGIYTASDDRGILRYSHQNPFFPLAGDREEESGADVIAIIRFLLDLGDSTPGYLYPWPEGLVRQSAMFTPHMERYLPGFRRLWSADDADLHRLLELIQDYQGSPTVPRRHGIYRHSRDDDDDIIDNRREWARNHTFNLCIEGLTKFITADGGLVEKEPPRLALIVGPVCSGKSTYRREHFSSPEWVVLDAGLIYLELNQGSWKKFSKQYEEEMVAQGLAVARDVVRLRKNLVTELLLDCPDHIKAIAEGFKRLGYQVQVFDIDCSEETALERNEHREENNISAYFTESYHINWLLDVLGVPSPPSEAVEETASSHCDFSGVETASVADDGPLPEDPCQPPCDVPAPAAVVVAVEEQGTDTLWQRLKAKIVGGWR
ncbi:MAG: ATP-binding protein [Magnetococcales bacterium]|nr:ATP-binding protein [Magnetococcales bacterium]